MQRIWWIGGSPCAGKSTAAAELARLSGRTYYKCDDRFDEHMKRGKAAGLPTSTVLSGASASFVFMRSLEENVRLAWSIFEENFEFIREDLARIEGGIVVEGCALLPHCVAANGVPAEAVHYLVPTEEFQRRHYAKRTWAKDRLKDTADVERAFENWMVRDVEFARRVAAGALANGYACDWVDGGRTPEETLEALARKFGLG